MLEVTPAPPPPPIASAALGFPVDPPFFTARLAAALQKATGKAVDVRVVIDESVMGGLVATVGDTVIDGSIASKLDQMRASLATIMTQWVFQKGQQCLAIQTPCEKPRHVTQKPAGR